MPWSFEHRTRRSKYFGVPLPFVSFLTTAAGGIYSVIVGRIVDVQFVGIYSDNWAILLMKFT